MICGPAIAALFFYIAALEPQNLFPGVAIGVYGLVFCAITWFFNFKAYFYIENGQLRGRYHYFSKINCKLSDVEFVLAQTNTLTVQLKNGKRYTIRGIENSWELCAFIRRNIPFEVTDQPQTLIQRYVTLRAERRLQVFFFCIGISLLFIIVLVTVFLTEGKELYEFSEKDWRIMAVMGALELINIIWFFCIALKIGKSGFPLQRLYYELRRSQIETFPLLPGNHRLVLCDENYTGRITVFGYPNSESVYYTIEHLMPDHNLVETFTSEVFDDIGVIQENFQSLIDISEKFF